MFKSVLDRQMIPWAPAVNTVAICRQLGANLPCHFCSSKTPSPTHTPLMSFTIFCCCCVSALVYASWSPGSLVHSAGSWSSWPACCRSLVFEMHLNASFADIKTMDAGGSVVSEGVEVFAKAAFSLLWAVLPQPGHRDILQCGVGWRLEGPLLWLYLEGSALPTPCLLPWLPGTPSPTQPHLAHL